MIGASNLQGTRTWSGAGGGAGDVTSPDGWDRWAESLPPIALDASRAVVVAPHPDDETFGCGGLIAELRARGASVTVVSASDGGASHPGVAGLAVRRRAEQTAAVQTLGCTHPPIWLGLPDGGLGRHAERLARELEPLLVNADLVVAPWAGDGHPDHEVVGRVATAEAGARAIPVLAYPVWWWRWGRPEDLAGARARRLPLSARAQAAKDRAIGCFPSQTTALLGEAIVDADMVARFTRPFEVYLDA